MGSVTGIEQSVLDDAASRAVRDAQAIATFALPVWLERVGMPLTWLGDLVDRIDNGKKLPPRRRVLGLAAWILTLIPDIATDTEALAHARQALLFFDWERETRNSLLHELAMEGIQLLHEQGTRPGSQITPPEWVREVFSVGVCLAVVQELGKD